MGARVLQETAFEEFLKTNMGIDCSSLPYYKREAACMHRHLLLTFFAPKKEGIVGDMSPEKSNPAHDRQS